MPLDGMEWMGNSIFDWTLAAVAALAVILALPLIKQIALSYARKHVNEDKVRVWDIVARCLSRTYFPVVLIFAFYVASELLLLPINLQRFISVAVVVGLFSQVTIWVISVVDLYVSFYEKKEELSDSGRSTAIYLISFFVKMALISIVFLVTLDQLGVNITALIAGLGVGGIAIALAAQTILGDLFASLTIVLDKPFQIGDFLIVDDYLGTVERVGLKTTRLKSLSGEQLVFSNNDLLQSRIKNYKRMQERRVVFGFGILYETPSEKLREIPAIVQELVEKHENVRFDRAHFKGFGAYSLDFEVVYHVLSADFAVYMDIQQAINIDLFERFEQMAVGFAYPTQKLYFEPSRNQDPFQGSSYSTEPEQRSVPNS